MLRFKELMLHIRVKVHWGLFSNLEQSEMTIIINNSSLGSLWNSFLFKKDTFYEIGDELLISVDS